jgi:hypothetical protein
MSAWKPARVLALISWSHCEQATVRCLADNGRLLEIGKYDILKGTPLSMRPMLRNVAFEGIDLDRITNDPCNITEVGSSKYAFLIPGAMYNEHMDVLVVCVTMSEAWSARGWPGMGGARTADGWYQQRRGCSSAAQQVFPQGGRQCLPLHGCWCAIPLPAFWPASSLNEIQSALRKEVLSSGSKMRACDTPFLGWLQVPTWARC